MGAGESGLSGADQGAQASQEPSEGVPDKKDQDNQEDVSGTDQVVQASQEDQDNKEDDFESSEWTEVCEKFEDMKLKDELLKGIYEFGYDKPSNIQQRGIVPCIKCHDTIAQAQSGVGKTATFCISALQRLNIEDPNCQVLILTPTTEVASDTYKVLNHLGNHMNIKSHACAGGTAVSEDIKILQGGVQIVFGTPGCVTDMINRNALNLKKLQMFVLDEADTMLSLGFEDKIYDIYQHLPAEVQVCLFSATMPDEVLKMTQRFMRNPVRILVKKEALTLQGRQFYLSVEQEEWKLDTICDLYETLTVVQAVIYCKTRQKTEWLQDKMTSRGFTVSCMHGEMDMAKRQQIMKDFKLGVSSSSRILITTELLERGTNAPLMACVVNYDLPNQENYIHRVGVSDRFDGVGAALTFISAEEIRSMREIEEFYKTKIEEMPQDVTELL